MTKAHSQVGDNGGRCEGCNKPESEHWPQTAMPLLLGGGIGWGTIWLCTNCQEARKERDQARAREKLELRGRIAMEQEGAKGMTNDDWKPGVYKHYKGGMYAALMRVAHHETREPMVVYFSLEKGNVQVREYAQSPPGSRHHGEGCDASIDAWTDVVEWKVPMPDGSAATHGPRFVFVRDFA